MTGRNDPCPCGSGRKYKHCCLHKDEARHPALRALAGRQVGTTAPRVHDGMLWEVDYVPIPASFGDDPTARPVAAMILAGDFIVRMEVHPHPPAEVSAVASVLAREIAAAKEATGASPGGIVVRTRLLADALAPLLEPVPVSVAPLVELDAALAHMDRELFGLPEPLRGRRSVPETWAGWGLARSTVERVFAASAEFYRAAPWRVLTNDDVVEITAPEGSTWHTIVMGDAGEAFGLAMYASRAEVEALLSGAVSPEHMASILGGPTISLTFSPADDLPRAMRREIRAARWPIAAPEAYPDLIVLNTPGGGITEGQAADLATALELIPRFVSTHEHAIEATGEPIDWVDPVTHAIVGYEWVGPPNFWPLPDRLEPCGPTGGAATPGKYLLMSEVEQALRRELEVVAAFERWLSDAARARPVSAATARKHGRIARLLVETVVAVEFAPLAAITELDLRVFLYDVLPRKHPQQAVAAALGSLRRFFEFLASAYDIRCPWADALLDDTDSFELRVAECPDGPWWDPDVSAWIQELTLDLDARVLLPEPDDADRTENGMAIVTDRSISRGRRWLQWRDEVIAAGITDPTEVHARLVARAREA